MPKRPRPDHAYAPHYFPRVYALSVLGRTTPSDSKPVVQARTYLESVYLLDYGDCLPVERAASRVERLDTDVLARALPYARTWLRHCRAYRALVMSLWARADGGQTWSPERERREHHRARALVDLLVAEAERRLRIVEPLRAAVRKARRA